MFNSTSLDSPRFPLTGALAVAFCVAFTAGCTATVATRPMEVTTSSEADVTYVDAAPVNVETYPHEYYGGANVYLVDGRWYRRSANRWTVYRSEPVELGRRRVVIEHARPRNQPVRVEERREEHGYRR